MTYDQKKLLAESELEIGRLQKALSFKDKSGALPVVRETLNSQASDIEMKNSQK